MFGNILLSILISILIILIIHNIFLFFQNNLTSPKVKDFVNKPNERYKEIYDIIDNSYSDNKNITKFISNVKNTDKKDTSNIDSIPNIIPSSSYTDDNLIFDNKKNNNSMKSELKNFLNSLADA